MSKIKNMFSRKYSITVIGEDWKPIKNNIKVKHIPRIEELIFLEEFDSYFKIVNVIHYLNEKHGIFIVVQKYFQEKI